MFKGNRNLGVGLFVSTALAGVAVFAMWLAGSVGNQDVQRYTVLFTEDVSGLTLGSPVFYLGVNVGSVINMEILTGEQVRVQVDIEILADTPVDSGSFASLRAQGITGVVVVNISGEPGSHGPLTEVPGFEYPLIPVRQTGLSALLSQAPDTLSKINLALDQVNQLLGEENRAAVAALLTQMETLSGALMGERDELAALPGELRELLVEARAVVRQVNGLLNSAGPDVDTVLENLGEASARLAELTARVDRLLADNAAEFEHFIDSGLGQAPELIFELRETLRSVHKLVEQLEEDPSQLIHRPHDDALEVEPQ